MVSSEGFDEKCGQKGREGTAWIVEAVLLELFGRAYEDDEIKEMLPFALALRVFNANDFISMPRRIWVGLLDLETGRLIRNWSGGLAQR